MPIFYNSDGEVIKLGRELGRGGEGAVFELSEDAAQVAKIYHEPIDLEKSEKLGQMVALKSEKLLKLAAWVTDTLHDTPHGKTVGFLMPRVSSATAIHELYNPRSRRQHFPEADWRFLLHAAANLARAFSVVHQHNHVIGDVNHGNVVIARDATVRLIDCDSYHLNAAEKSYLCEVGVSTHTPPELQGHSLRELERTANHDRFGLAVLIFQLLFMGRHPFSGAFLGAGDSTLESSIAARRFAFGDDAADRQMKQPPGTLPLAAVTPEIENLFKRAFLEIENRPTAREWVETLGAQSENLRECAANTGHYYWQNLAKCPWCALEAKTGVLFFPARFTGDFGADGELDLYTLGQLIDAIKPPEAVQNLAIKPQNQLVTVNLPASPGIQATLANYNTGLTAYLGVLSLTIVLLVAFVGFSFLFYVFQLAFGGFWLCWGIIKTLSKRAADETQSALDAAYEKWEAFKEQSDQKVLHAGFDTKRAELKTAIKEYSELSKRKEALCTEIAAARRADNLEAHLAGFSVRDSGIAGLTDERVEALEQNNVKSARDVTTPAFAAMPQFSFFHRRKLIEWRAELEKQFVFEPNAVVKHEVAQAAELEIAQIRQQLEAKLRHGLPELQQIVSGTNQRQQNLAEQSETLQTNVRQAESDSKRISDLQKNAVAWTLGVALVSFGVGIPVRQMIYQEEPTIVDVAPFKDSGSTNGGSEAISNPNPKIAQTTADDVTPEEWGEAGEFYEKGEKFFEDEEYKKAVAAFKQAVNLRPDIKVIHKRLAESYDKLKLYEDAIKSYGAALAIDPADRDSLYGSGEIYGKLNYWASARSVFKKAALKSAEFDGYSDDKLAANLRKNGRLTGAIEFLKYIIKDNSGYAEAHYELGLCYLAANEFEKANAQHKRLVSLDQALAQKLYEQLPTPGSGKIGNYDTVKPPPPAPRVKTMPMRSAP